MNKLLLSFSFGNLIIVLTGILIGLLLSLLILILIIKKSMKKVKLESNIEKNKELKNLDNIEIVNKKINSIKDKYKEMASDKKLGDKMNILKDSVLDLTEGIAKIYYPESTKPLYELTFKEATVLVDYVTTKVNTLLDYNVVTRFIRRKQIKPFIDSYEKLMAIFDNKFVKTTTEVIGTFNKVLHIINPYYWTKKFLIDLILNTSINMLSDIVIDVVGIETAKVYSKSIFNTNNDTILEKELLNLNILENEEEM